MPRKMTAWRTFNFDMYECLHDWCMDGCSFAIMHDASGRDDNSLPFCEDHFLATKVAGFPTEPVWIIDGRDPEIRQDVSYNKDWPMKKYIEYFDKQRSDREMKIKKAIEAKKLRAAKRVCKCWNKKLGCTCYPFEGDVSVPCDCCSVHNEYHSDSDSDGDDEEEEKRKTPAVARVRMKISLSDAKRNLARRLKERHRIYRNK